MYGFFYDDGETVKVQIVTSATPPVTRKSSAGNLPAIGGS
jgi:hypothetical protein